MMRFDYTEDTGRAAWLRRRLSPEWPTLAAQVPEGFDRYVRIFDDVEGSSWREVCAQTRAMWHPLMQWRSISRGWAGGAPEEGSLGASTLALLADCLDDGPITVGLWNGHGQIGGQGTFSLSFDEAGTGTPPVRDEAGWVTLFDTDVLAGPLLSLPGREYILFTGAVTTLRTPRWREHSGWAWRWNETVNVAWADDESWFLLSEIDYDSTVVACTEEIARCILASPLETAFIKRGDSLTYDADTLNG